MTNHESKKEVHVEPMHGPLCILCHEENATYGDEWCNRCDEITDNWIAHMRKVKEATNG